jgi:hypothetical protein
MFACVVSEHTIVVEIWRRWRRSRIGTPRGVQTELQRATFGIAATVATTIAIIHNAENTDACQNQERRANAQKDPTDERN